MPTYIYKARDAAGKLVKGAMDAADKDELAERLHRMGYMVTRVVEALPGKKIESVFEKLNKISAEDMIMFTLQLSNLINAGIGILPSLNTLNKQIENKRLKEVVGSISRNVEAGDSFSQALSRHPHIFSRLFVSMVKAGEASGRLDTILARYANYCEQQQDLRQKIKGAIFYPIILLFTGIAVTIFIVTFIIPQFAEIFIATGISLPKPTLILYKTGTGIKHYWYLILSVIIIIWLGIGYYISTERGRLNFDRFKLRIPVIGPLSRKIAISRFVRALSTLVASGVFILESLDIAKMVVGNEVLARVIGNVRNAVEKGERVSESLKISEEFPVDTVQMISVGEETGNLDKMLHKVSDYYDIYVGYAVKKLTSVIEPFFLVVIGGLIGFIMASILLPIFDMMKILRH